MPLAYIGEDRKEDKDPMPRDPVFDKWFKEIIASLEARNKKQGVANG